MASPQKIGRAEITFHTDWDHPLESVFMDQPERMMPFTVRNYRLVDGTGRVLHAIENNHQARQVIAFQGRHLRRLPALGNAIQARQRPGSRPRSPHRGGVAEILLFTPDFSLKFQRG